MATVLFPRKTKLTEKKKKNGEKEADSGIFGTGDHVRLGEGAEPTFVGYGERIQGELLSLFSEEIKRTPEIGLMVVIINQAIADCFPELVSRYARAPESLDYLLGRREQLLYRKRGRPRKTMDNKLTSEAEEKIHQDCKEIHETLDEMESAMRFFSSQRFEFLAHLIGLDPDYVRRLLKKFHPLLQVNPDKTFKNVIDKIA